MSGERVLSYLRRLCCDIDAGRPLRPGALRALCRVAVPAVLAASASGLAGCPSSGPGEPTTPERPASEAACDDGVDEDGDGAMDCGDPDCATASACAAVLEYGAPYPADDTGAMPEYAAPMPE